MSTANTSAPAPEEERTRSPNPAKTQSKSKSPQQSRSSPKPQPAAHHVDIGSLKDQQAAAQDVHLDQHKYQQRQREEFQHGTDKARGEARERQESSGDQGERVHQRSGAKGSGGEGKKKRPESSLFVKHITNYPLLSFTYQEINSRLPIPIPNPTTLPIINKLPSPASFPVISSIDATLDGILNRLDSAFPAIKSSPEHLASQVAQITDPWVAPANAWLAEHLPLSKRSVTEDSAARERRKERGKIWGAKVTPGEKSYADAAAPENTKVSGDAEKEEQQDIEEMELRKTVAILMDALDAQIQRAEEARGYVAEVLLPGYVPIVGGWLGGKVKSKKEKPGKKTGNEERSGKKFDGQGQASKERGQRAMRENEKGEPVVQVGGETRRADEGVTVIGGREL